MFPGETRERGKSDHMWNSISGVMKTVKWATSKDNGDNIWSLQKITMVFPRAKARNTEVFSRHVIFRVKGMSFV
jgi:hypothetical protein